MPCVCEIVIVCEDRRHSRFVRAFLAAANVKGRIVTHQSTAGRGSAFDYVLDRYVEESRLLTRYREGHGLIGILDDDGHGPKRRRALEDKLKAAGLGELSPDAGRCLLIPARNIETWLYWLTAKIQGWALNIEETVNYKDGPGGKPPDGAPRRIAFEDCQPAGNHLHELDHTKLPDDCPPQLAGALQSLREFLRAVKR